MKEPTYTASFTHQQLSYIQYLLAVDRVLEIERKEKERDVIRFMIRRNLNTSIMKKLDDLDKNSATGEWEK